MTPEEIRELRLKLGLTQTQLGELVGARCKTVSTWELGKCKPHLLHAYKLEQLRKENNGEG